MLADETWLELVIVNPLYKALLSFLFKLASLML